MRLSLLATLAALAPLAVPAHAEDAFDAAAAMEDFFSDAASFGANEAAVGEVTAEGDTVTASAIRVFWETTVTAGEETATVRGELTIPTLSVTGLAETDDGYAADRIEAPRIHATINVSGSETPLTYDLTLTDYAVENGEWNTFPAIVSNPAAPVSRFAPLVDWLVHQSYEETSIGRVALDISTGDDRQEIAYGPISIGPVADGTLAELRYDELTLTQTTEVPDDSGGMKPTEVTITYGPITARDIDMKPGAALFTGMGAASGPQSVAGNITIERIAVADDTVRLSTGNIVIDDFTVDASRGPIATRLDDFVVASLRGEEPDPVAVANFVLDIYGAYGFALYSIQNIAFAAPGLELRLGDIRSEGLSASGLDRVALLDASATVEGGSGSLGAFELGGFVFPPREAVMNAVLQSMAGAEPTPETVLAALPTLGRFAIRDLKIDAGDGSTFDLGNFALDLSDYVGAIPTEIAVVLEGLVMPAALLPDPGTAAMAQMIGADPVRADGTLKLRWDADTQRVELDEDVAIGGIGRLRTDATLSGIPGVIFEDPQRVEEALATAAVNGVTIHFADEGLTPFLIGMISEQSGLAPEEFAEGIAAQAEMQLGALTGDPAFAAGVADAVRTYLADPRALTVSAAPANPVAVAQIIGAAMTAPAALPGLLNFSVTANPE
jgi:hypothetical protein